MKHPRKPSAQQPDRIARTTIELVEQTLREVGFVPENRDLWVRIERFAAALALWGGRTNLTAAPNDSKELAFHIIDSLAPLIVAGRREGSILRGGFEEGQRVLDLGSGAGFPGLILAAAGGGHFTLLEARRKRASFLTVAAAEMGLSNVEVDARRGQPGQRSSTFDVVTGRAYARPAIFYRAAGAALRPGGLAILYANPEQKLEAEATAEWGLSGAGLIAYAIPRGSRRVERILSIWRKR